MIEPDLDDATALEDVPPRTALIVEDDAVYRELLVMALESEGYRAFGAEDGAKALELIKVSTPDVIILDLLMPVMDGLSFLKALKEAGGVAIPTLVHTALEARSCVVDALVAGAGDVLAKPAPLEEILKRIEGLG